MGIMGAAVCVLPPTQPHLSLSPSTETPSHAPKRGTPHTLRSKMGKAWPRIWPPYSASVVLRLQCSGLPPSWAAAAVRASSHASTVRVLGVGGACACVYACVWRHLEY